MELVSAMVREMQSRARHGWQAVQGSFTTYSNKWQRVWTLRGPQDECGALSCDGAARRKTCLSQSARIRLFGRTCMLFYLRLGRIRPYSTPPDPWAPGASPGPVLRATYAALVAHEEAPARVCLKCRSHSLTTTSNALSKPASYYNSSVSMHTMLIELGIGSDKLKSRG